MSIKKEIERNIIFSLTLPPRLFQSKKYSLFLCRIKLSTSALARLVQQREEYVVRGQQRDDGTTENGEKREQQTIK